MSSTPQGQGDPVLPEDLGRNCAKLLLEEVYRVGTAEARCEQELTLCLCNSRFYDVTKIKSFSGSSAEDKLSQSGSRCFSFFC